MLCQLMQRGIGNQSCFKLCNAAKYTCNYLPFQQTHPLGGCWSSSSKRWLICTELSNYLRVGFFAVDVDRNTPLCCQRRYLNVCQTWIILVPTCTHCTGILNEKSVYTYTVVQLVTMNCWQVLSNKWFVGKRQNKKALTKISNIVGNYSRNFQ